MSTEQTAAPLPRDPAALEKLIAERRDHLATTVEELVERSRPRAVADRAVRGARGRLHEATTDEDGRLRVERLLAVGAAGVVVVALWALRRRRGRH